MKHPILLLAAFCAAPLAAAEPGTLIAERTLVADGTLVPGLAVVVDENGRIARVVPADQDELPAPVRRFGAGSVLSPGLHELLGALGAPGELEETARPIDPGADAAAAIDPMRRDLERARQGGILVATVAPAPRNPVAGRAVTFATGARPALERLDDGPGPLVFAVGESALDAQREPTSRSGLRRALVEWLDAAAAAGGLPRARAAPFVHCDEAMDVVTALELFGDLATPVLGGDSAAAFARETPEPRAALAVVGPYAPESAPATVRGAAALAAAGIELALRGAMPAGGADSLRASARRAVAHGLDPAAARRAITVNPARAVGLADRIGSIEPGRRADLVVFSGDPLLAGSAVIAVIQGGADVPLGRAAPPEIGMESPR